MLIQVLNFPISTFLLLFVGPSWVCIPGRSLLLHYMLLWPYKPQVSKNILTFQPLAPSRPPLPMLLKMIIANLRNCPPGRRQQKRGWRPLLITLTHPWQPYNCVNLYTQICSSCFYTQICAENVKRETTKHLFIVHLCLNKNHIKIQCPTAVPVPKLQAFSQIVINWCQALSISWCQPLYWNIWPEWW